MSASAAKPAGEQDHAARDALHVAERPGPEATDGDRGERHDRHDDAGRGRRHPPPVDEEEHDEEERGDEAARDEEQCGVRGDRRSPGGAGTGRAPAPRAASNNTSASGTCARKIDSQPSSSVRIPPAAGPSAAPSTPAATQVRSAASSLPFARERRSSAAVTSSAAPSAWTHRAPTSTSNDGASPHASDANAKTTTPDDERLARPPPRDVGRGHGDDREHEIERGQHPRDGRDRDVELAEDLRQRERHDGRIRKGEPDAESEQRRAHGASLGSWLRCRDATSPYALGGYGRRGDRGYRLRIEVLASNSVGTVRAVGKVTRVVR